MKPNHVHNGVEYKRVRAHGAWICPECNRLSRRAGTRRAQDYDGWWDRQHGLCAFCGEPMDYEIGNHLDHNHVTGRKRGLVHPACNHMIGGFENAVRKIGLRRALAYLR